MPDRGERQRSGEPGIQWGWMPAFGTLEEEERRALGSAGLKHSDPCAVGAEEMQAMALSRNAPHDVSGA